MLAKGRLLGVQFEALLEDGLYAEIGRRAVDQALRLRQAILDKGWPLLIDSPTNQQFPILPDKALEQLSQRYTSCFWCKPDADHTAVRFCTSWSTREEDIDTLIADIQKL
jgi:threonine aldolase